MQVPGAIVILDERFGRLHAQSLKLTFTGTLGILLRAKVARRIPQPVRKTIHSVIATRCIEGGYDLLHNDRDFDPFAKHLGLGVVV
jgi:predicted nucleic acid-binding protein